MSLALARKYRPRKFSAVAVQTHVSRTLRSAIARDRIAHAYLLCGPRGTGKTTLARVLAMALNCERRLSGEIADEGEPCGECGSCQRIWSGAASLDVVEIDAASNRGVDDARELRERAMYAPSGERRFKVYIIDEAHMLTREAWNALLKILEEPPPRVVFVFATTEPQKIAQSAAPVLSRVQRFDLKRIGASEIRERLAEILAAERIRSSADAVAMIARAADGSMRDALSLADQVISHAGEELTAGSVRESLGLVADEEFVILLDVVLQRRPADVFPAVARLADAGVDFNVLFAGVADTFRAALAAAVGSEAPDVSEGMRAALAERRGSLTAADLIRMLNMITALEPRFRRSSQQQLLLEALLVRFALLDRTVDIEELLRGTDSGGGSGEGSEPRRETPGTEPQRGARQARGARPAAREPRRGEATRDSARALAPPPGARADPAQASTASSRQPLELNRLVERWDDIVARLRESGRAMLASHFASSIPAAISKRGVVTIQLDDNAASAFDIVQEALATAQGDVVNSLGSIFTGVERVVLAPLESRQASARPAARRLTEESVRAEKLEMLRRKDPLLDAAVRELDLELLE